MAKCGFTNDKSGGPFILDTTYDYTANERQAIVRVSFEMLSKLLQLPDEATIEFVRYSDYSHKMVDIHIRGEGWLVFPNYGIPIATGLVTEYRDEDGRCFKRVISWNELGV